MDVTLRDGSYEVNFKFTKDDVRFVGDAIKNSGIEYFEIGHGQGLNASSEKNGIAACTDREYLETASEYLSGLKYGTFCIPGIARLEDLDLLSTYGASFVRIGCNTDEESVKKTKPFIQRAKNLGLEVYANYMKTYVADSEEFIRCVRLSEEYGADTLVIVDSAGCMLPEDIKKYYDLIRDNSKKNVQIGFHGHDNLGLSVSNSLYALQIGCDIVDTSLQSLGRGAGNASTEQLIAILLRLAPECHYKLGPLMHFSEDYLREMVKFKGVSGLDTYCGIAGFHSGYMNSIRKAAKEYNLDPYDLIVEYCKIDRKYLDEELLTRIAIKMK
ncbi:MAG: 4-hydroxy-2-oxovalerate aldolase [Helicobacter sp.]|nr:4-hydroxy-2-oxovalerate aldolase [Helicobacter sp.]